MEETEKIGSVQSEIEVLKKRIAELEAISTDKARPEIIKEALKEHTEKIPEQVLTKEHRLPVEEIKKQAERIGGLKNEEEPHQRQVLELLQISQDKGILNAISIAKQLDPHLEDDFHDALVRYLSSMKYV